MPGPIQITYLLIALGIIVLYVQFFRSLINNSVNVLTKILWILLAIILPVLGPLVYFALKNQLVIHWTDQK